jgi:hypothetical protein
MFAAILPTLTFSAGRSMTSRSPLEQVQYRTGLDFLRGTGKHRGEATRIRSPTVPAAVAVTLGGAPGNPKFCCGCLTIGPSAPRPAAERWRNACAILRPGRVWPISPLLLVRCPGPTGGPNNGLILFVIARRITSSLNTHPRTRTDTPARTSALLRWRTPSRYSCAQPMSAPARPFVSRKTPVRRARQPPAPPLRAGIGVTASQSSSPDVRRFVDQQHAHRREPANRRLRPGQPPMRDPFGNSSDTLSSRTGSKERWK